MHNPISHPAKYLSDPRTCKEICQHVLSKHMVDLERTVFDKLLNKEVLGIDVSCIGRRRTSSHNKCHSDRGRVALIDRSCLLRNP